MGGLVQEQRTGAESEGNVLRFGIGFVWSWLGGEALSQIGAPGVEVIDPSLDRVDPARQRSVAATVAVLVFDLQGRRSFRSRARPLCLSAWPLCGAWWEARRLGSVRSSLTLTARRRTRSTLLPLTRGRRCASLAVEGNHGVTGALPAASSDVQCGQRRALSGMLMAQWPHSFVAGPPATSETGD